MSLVELTELIEHNTNKKEKTRLIWECIQDPPKHLCQHPHFSRLRTVLQQWWQTRYQKPLHISLSGVWYALGGPACYETPTILKQASAFFELLATHDVGGRLTSRETFEQAMKSLYAPADSSDDCQLQIMTLHKAKGLEFDIVLLPYLEKTPPTLEQPLLRYQYGIDAHDSENILLAPIKRTHDSQPDRIYRYLQYQEQQRLDHETIRLLYVGTTRAKTQLHLIGEVDYHTEKQMVIRPKKNSFLGQLFDHIDTTHLIDDSRYQDKNRMATPVAQNRLLRLPANWQLPSTYQQAHACFDQRPPSQIAVNQPTPTAVFDSAVGTLIHRLLR